MALVEAIDQGIVAGAAFDVFESEPPAADHPFLNHPSIIVTPHLGASTVEAQEKVAIDVSEQSNGSRLFLCECFFRGHS